MNIYPTHGYNPYLILFGIYMGYTWDIHGIYMGYTWDIHGIYTQLLNAVLRKNS
jgi:hypothetical protein